MSGFLDAEETPGAAFGVFKGAGVRSSELPGCLQFPVHEVGGGAEEIGAGVEGLEGKLEPVGGIESALQDLDGADGFELQGAGVVGIGDPEVVRKIQEQAPGEWKRFRARPYEMEAVGVAAPITLSALAPLALAAAFS